MNHRLRRWTCGAGLIAGPLAWAINTEASYASALHSCATQRAVLGPTMTALIMFAAAGGLVSAVSAATTASAPLRARGGHPDRLLALIGAGAGLLFAVVLADQFAALLMVGPCAQ